LQEALKAYDAALARDPGDRDARHNRDLVARALQNQETHSKPSSAGNSSSSDQSKAAKGHANSKDAATQGNASPNSSAQNSAGKDQPDNAAQSGSEANRSVGQKAGQQQSAMRNPSRQSGEQNAQPNSQKNGQVPGQPQTADDAAQARRDAAASLGKLQPGQSSALTSPPISEQQLAQEQWLQRIPDDPGGLLRRKFLIEHMIRKQEGRP
jgi:Ca-activated chloride channel homolog